MRKLPVLSLATALVITAGDATAQIGFVVEERIAPLLTEMPSGGSDVRSVVDRLIKAVEASCGQRSQRPPARYEQGLRLQSGPNDSSAVNRTVGNCALAFRATLAIAKLGPPPQSAFTLSGDAYVARKRALERIESPTAREQAESWVLAKREESATYRHRANGGITGVRVDPCRYCVAACLRQKGVPHGGTDPRAARIELLIIDRWVLQTCRFRTSRPPELQA